MNYFTIGIFFKSVFSVWLLPFKYIPLIIATVVAYVQILRQSCTVKKSSSDQTQLNIPKQHCETCKIIRYYRMRHCTECRSCIHKFDHHCYFMQVCIGEFNHKWYVAFLLLKASQEIVALIAAWKIIPDEVFMDQNGIQHFTKMFFPFAFQIFYASTAIVICVILSWYHLQYIAYNTTTWEQLSREKITYMRPFSMEQIRYPFSKGIINNIRLTLNANKDNPIQWNLL